MWVRVWMALILPNVWSQQTSTSTRVQQGGAAFEWGWHLNSPEESPGTVGHYIVNVPQVPSQIYQNAAVPNATLLPQNNGQPPLQLYLLQQHFSSPSIAQQDQVIQVLPAVPSNVIQYHSIPNYYSGDLKPLYNIYTQHPVQNQQQNTELASDKNERTSKSLQNKEVIESNNDNNLSEPIVKVFQDHNCTENEGTGQETTSKEIDSDIRKSKELFAEIPNYEARNINGNFGAKAAPRQPQSYRGAVSFRVEALKPRYSNEIIYATTQSTPTSTEIDKATEDGIRKLVESTQDLITNEDLLRINHAIEKHFHYQNDDIIRPKARISPRNDIKPSYYDQEIKPTQIRLKAKIKNIVHSDIKHLENIQPKEQGLQTSSNEYKFALPIIVSDSPESYKEQIVNNIVSTMIPYIEKGYEIVGVKKVVEENDTCNHCKKNSNEEEIYVTPRPIGQKYLAPITVALRLINAGYNDTQNSLEDHETADSEIISETIEKPVKEKTIVEIFESQPVEITHINDVETHEYLDIGRSNRGPLDLGKNFLYNRYVEALKSSKEIQQNMNEILNKYEDMNKHGNANNFDKAKLDDSKEQIEASENVNNIITVNPNERKSEYEGYYNKIEAENYKIIQPIVIEKEIPITKFVDRFIEKKVAYPERVEVQVPYDRPVPVAVPYEKIVEKPVEVTRYVNNPYPVEVSRPYPVEVKVPYPVEQKIYVDRPVQVPYPVQTLVENHHVHPYPVPTPVGIPVEVPVTVERKVLYPITVEKPVPFPVEVEKTVEKIVQQHVPVPYEVEKQVPYPVHYETKVPVPYPVEKQVPYPVEKIVEKPVTITKVVEKSVEVPVAQPFPVPIHVYHAYPVDRIVEKKVPYPVPVHIEKKVQVPYPVEKIVEKIVEKPVVVTKYVDKPYPVEKMVPYPVEKIVERKVPYPVHVPFEVKIPVPVEIPMHNLFGYRYGHGHGDESRNHPQYNNYNVQPNSQNQNHLNSNLKAQYLKHNSHNHPHPLIQTTHWGNQYASSYQYINNTAYHNFLDLKNKSQSPPNHNINSYIGPPPANPNYNEEKNRNYLEELKLRRTDRTPKTNEVRLEYGFKPPLIPSTRIDSDGKPIKEEE